MFKYLIERGANYLREGSADFDAWSERMVTGLGPNVKPFLQDIMQWSLVLASRGARTDDRKINCWEYKKCSSHERGVTTPASEICPVSLETRFNGIYGGRNGGRSCWLVRETLCGGRNQRTAVHKFIECFFCDFKKYVIMEEGPDFLISDTILKSLIE